MENCQILARIHNFVLNLYFLQILHEIWDRLNQNSLSQTIVLIFYEQKTFVRHFLPFSLCVIVYSIYKSHLISVKSDFTNDSVSYSTSSGLILMYVTFEYCEFYFCQVHAQSSMESSRAQGLLAQTSTDVCTGKKINSMLQDIG